MRCSCQRCDTYMVHAESFQLGCVCPECGYRCRACLGTNTVVDRVSLKELASRPDFLEAMLDALPDDAEDAADLPGPAADPSDPAQWDD